MATPPDAVDAARALRTTILAARQEPEGRCRLAPSVVAGLIETGLCRLKVKEEHEFIVNPMLLPPSFSPRPQHFFL
jgi:hypothetical protein